MRIKKYGDNLKESYNALVSSYCSKEMQNRIENFPTYQSTIQDNPIEVLNTTKLIMHNPERTKHAYASLTESLHQILTMRQQVSYALKSHVGP